MTTQLIDNSNRIINSLRISVTDRCNFRCFYCMSEDEIEYYDRSEILTFEEIKRLSEIFVGLSVNKIRLTGGEPLIRRDITKLIQQLTSLLGGGLKDLSLTTNGFMLKDLAEELYAAGLRRINVSLDSLNPHKFARLTRRDALPRVLEGLEVAAKCGFSPIKINVVAIRGFTEDEILDFARMARTRPFIVRFIEFMPLDMDGRWGKIEFIPGEEIIDKINAVYPLELLDTSPNFDAAKRYRFKDGSGEIGVVASVSEPFCDRCNRVRLTADGKLRTCLFSLDETDLKSPMRSGASDEELKQIIIKAIKDKEQGHKIQMAGFVKPKRSMSMIGG
ncbi:GTP 3',8-cyclase MoaA [Candidatus Poribacteria bacterium]|nr:GTP 3',8-cyclase MoaA [Candidatus Poribacteria bacterium]